MKMFQKYKHKIQILNFFSKIILLQKLQTCSHCAIKQGSVEILEVPCFEKPALIIMRVHIYITIKVK